MREQKLLQNVEQRIVIKFLGENVQSTEIHHRLQQQYGEECLSWTRVFEWCKCFREGRERVENKPHDRWPRRSTTEPNIDCADALITVRIGASLSRNLEKLYTNTLFERCFEVTEGTNLTLREFWKYHFHIVACLKTIEKAWERVTKRTLTSAWKKLWPESVAECDFEGFETVPVEPVVNEIVSLIKIMGLEVDNNDIDELVEKHSQELTTEELMEFHCVSQQEVVEKSLSEEEEEEEDVTAKQQSFWCNKRNAESMGNCCIVH
ncbi:hypothetical protein B7P43_G11706 [Cryptotermes secundus]|uniref:Mos1 transposase HTH domain-containing protein n=1 Tax=Cryptotermes secundus TaxID=105785 RepID=A0A2J7PRT4_9NEOP|nr:hypothetical protein B7P43_G11706 [Cryptotermes secundus]